jgi:hypothetical protein
MAYLFKINPTQIEINPTRLKNQNNPKIKPNPSLETLSPALELMVFMGTNRAKR